MTHLPYILASYWLFAGLAGILAIGAALRLKAARTKLATLENSALRRSGAPTSQ
ncbi:MAG: hypothetical protein ABF553_02680 [Acetobacter orientalis]|uniref:hypothetical protein n=1 Tax=Acetobacter orientalis TaxID=146474 RepID=UPI0039EAE5DA